jgi:hypothetical protein
MRLVIPAAMALALVAIAQVLTEPLGYRWPAQASSNFLGSIWVSPVGNDANNCVFTPAQTPTDITKADPTKACKTLTHACDLAQAQVVGTHTGAGGWRVYVLPRTATNPYVYLETAVCHAGGSSPTDFFEIIGQGPANVWTGVTPGVPAITLTGSHIHFGKIEMLNTPGDALLVQGMPGAPAVDVQLYYNTTMAHNDGHAIVADQTSYLKIDTDTIYNNTGDCIVISNSDHWDIENTSISRCGSLTGVPTTKKNGTVVTNSPNGFYDAPLEPGGPKTVATNLVLSGSPYATIQNNAMPAGYAVFTCTISPASDKATDILTNNGPGCQ